MYNRANREAYLIEHVRGGRRITDRASVVTLAVHNVAKCCSSRPDARLDHELAQRLGTYKKSPNTEEWAVYFVT